mmetsp:Transcript_42574/g.90722  ORF Transcript_42574/g.90722 Transcript_42574/m.90722 type:complete len:290 (+) Transcript_42574:63-932(+)
MGAGKVIAPLVFSAVLFFIFAYSAILMKRFSPVYTPVECVNTNKTFEFTVNDTGAFVTAFSVMECTNPNPFSVKIAKGSPGRVFFYPEMIDIGQVVVGEYALEEGGTAEMKADVALHIKPEEIPLLLQGVKHILEEMHVNAVAHLSVLGFPIAYEFNQMNTCGFGMETYPATMSYKTGPAICATSQDELLRIIPDLDAPSTPYKISVDTAMLNKAEMMRDAGCGSAMGISALLGLLFLRLGLRPLFAEGKAMRFLRSTSSTAEKTADPCPEPEKTDPFPEPEKSPANAV